MRGSKAKEEKVRQGSCSGNTGHPINSPWCAYLEQSQYSVERHMVPGPVTAQRVRFNGVNPNSSCLDLVLVQVSRVIDHGKGVRKAIM